MRDDPSTRLFVCVDTASSARFTNELAEILRSRGFDPSLGRAVDEFGHTNFVIEAKKGSVTVWAQNAPVDPPTEVPDLNNYSAGLSVDPNQYVISVQSRVPLYKSGARRVFETLRKDLHAKGFKSCPPGITAELR